MVLKSFGSFFCRNKTLRVNHPANGKAFPASRQVPFEVALGAKDFQTCSARKTIEIQISYMLQIVFGRFMPPDRLKARESPWAMRAAPKFVRSLGAAYPKSIEDFGLEPRESVAIHDDAFQSNASALFSKTD